MEGDEVGLGPNIGQIHQLNAEFRSRVLGKSRIEADDFHAAGTPRQEEALDQEILTLSIWSGT